MKDIQRPQEMQVLHNIKLGLYQRLAAQVGFPKGQKLSSKKMMMKFLPIFRKKIGKKRIKPTPVTKPTGLIPTPEGRSPFFQ
ncbi:MAG TPA: hypothetical protein VKZ75_01240 [Cyclobacteriaceae bacterium]|nr:hypothetical protein [Cyclobacteriaceae bacterium]